MKAFLIQRLLYLIVAVWLVMTLTFVMVHLLPGDPFSSEQMVSPHCLAELRARYHFDKPLYIQYFYYWKALLQGNLGYSLLYPDRLVSEILRTGCPISFTLGGEALLLALLLGIPLGVVSALQRRRLSDKVIVIWSVIGISLPSFATATLLQYFFALKLHWLPIARWGSFSQTIMPAAAIAFLPAAFIARLVRSNLLEQLDQEYIRTAFSKGLSFNRVIWRHALPNALLPVASYVGHLTAHVLTGTFIVEKVFAIPGIGQWWVLSVMQRDYPLLMGVTFVYTLLLMFTILLLDVGYAFLNPRLRIQS